MSNRTKIKKHAPKPPEIEANVPSQPQKAPWRPPQTLLAAVIFVSLGIAILGNSLYLIVPAGIVLLAVLIWGGLTARHLGTGSRALKQFLMPGILILVLLVVRIITVLEKLN